MGSLLIGSGGYGLSGWITTKGGGGGGGGGRCFTALPPRNWTGNPVLRKKSKGDREREHRGRGPKDPTLHTHGTSTVKY